MMRMVWAGVTIVIGVGVLAGCASAGPSGAQQPTQPTPPPTATTAPAVADGVTVKRTGGFAGVNQAIVIAPDGSWVYTDARAGKTESGRFTEAQLAELARLAVDPRLVQELRQTPTSVCNDAYNYTLTVGSVAGSFEDCGQSRPAVEAILRHISDLTAF